MSERSSQDMYGQAKLHGQLGVLIGTTDVYRPSHPPGDVEAHARERLATLEKDIPLLSQKLAEMAIEKKRLERMLAALEAP